MIKNVGGKWAVYSEDGSKRLGGPYDSKAQAVKRLKQIEYWKHHSKENWVSLEEMRNLCPSCAEEMERRGLSKVQKGIIKHVLTSEYKGEPGWDDPKSWLSSKAGAESVRQKAWAGMGSSHHTCVAHMEGHVDDPARFCAALKDAVLGTTKWRGKGKEVAMEFDEFVTAVAEIFQAKSDKVEEFRSLASSYLEEKGTFPFKKKDEGNQEKTGDEEETDDEELTDEEKKKKKKAEKKPVIEAAEGEPVKVGESFSGSEIVIEEAATQSSALDIDVALIKPGFGNKKDNHFYSRELLERDSPKFIGAKMYETDHKPGEKSTRTWVSTITGLKGFTQEGAPIARVVVHDPSFAQRLVNLKEKNLLDKMECSILAGAIAEKAPFESEGRKGKRISQITSVESVDWVTRAGAGGHVLNIAEGEEAPDETPDSEEDPPTEEETEEIPEEENEPVMELSEDLVVSILKESQLPQVSQDRLSKGTYETEESLKEVIIAETEYLKVVTKSGKPFQMGESSPQNQHVRIGEAELTERLDEVDRMFGIST